MIKITDGTNEKIVTKGMFDSLYSTMGYRPVVTKKVEPKVVEPKVVEPKVVTEVKETVVEEKPKTTNNKKSK